ncbi:MAG: hypothetical protein ABWZ25_00915 [Chitinophagaceae bacterium]
MKMELRWSTGKCAYCNGSGQVRDKDTKRVPFDNGYLNMDISQVERRRLLRGDQGALKRAQEWNNQIDLLIAQIQYLHRTEKLDVDSITTFFLLPRLENEVGEIERQELFDYVTRVINHKA